MQLFPADSTSVPSHPPLWPAVGGEADSHSAPVYRLPSLPVLRLRFELRAREAGRLAGYKGSMLRGAFGHALRQLACTFGPRQVCGHCPLRSSCAYTRLFETFVEGTAPPFLRGVATAPRPLVIEPATAEREFAPSDVLSFDLLLIGRAAELAAYVLVAVERMAERGLGTDRLRFRLERVAARCEDGTWQEIGSKPKQLGPLPRAFEPPVDAVPEGPLRLRFVTPTRGVVEPAPAPTVSFRTLVFRMLRRHLELAHFVGDSQAINWHFRPLLVAADGVRVVESRLRWHDWQRHSHRQGKKIEMGGFLGHLVLDGELEPFRALLASAREIHVGKGAILGLGRLELHAA